MSDEDFRQIIRDAMIVMLHDLFMAYDNMTDQEHAEVKRELVRLAMEEQQGPAIDTLGGFALQMYVRQKCDNTNEEDVNLFYWMSVLIQRERFTLVPERNRV